MGKGSGGRGGRREKEGEGEERKGERREKGEGIERKGGEGRKEEREEEREREKILTGLLALGTERARLQGR